MAEVSIATANAAACAMCSNHSTNSITRNAARTVITVSVKNAEDLGS